jgi:hypothetical protein
LQLNSSDCLKEVFITQSELLSCNSRTEVKQ